MTTTEDGFSVKTGAENPSSVNDDGDEMCVAMHCNACGWESFPLTAEMFGDIGIDGTDETGMVLAVYTSTLHNALRHPQTVPNAEKIVADVAAEIGPTWFEITRLLALDEEFKVAL